MRAMFAQFTTAFTTIGVVIESIAKTILYLCKSAEVTAKGFHDETMLEQEQAIKKLQQSIKD